MEEKTRIAGKHTDGQSNVLPKNSLLRKEQMDLRFITPQSVGVDANNLEKELKLVIAGEVRFDKGTKALYSTDSSNYRQIPIGVVLPKSEEDIINTIAICKKYSCPVLSPGGGT
ncbi:MAG: FAD-binding oxidoreductase, partial [Bacteroidetes bacterium]|nr:FAD-binding oxidoreductase [Bacteroidota bacterium]